jgi:hypothetical protein
MADHKGTIIATIIVGLLGAVVALYIHNDGKNETDVAGTTTQASESREGTNDKADKKPSPSIYISEVFVTPIDTAIPTVFYSEVTNTGTGAAIDFEIRIDFGESTPEVCEVLSSANNSWTDVFKSPLKIFNIKKLGRMESIYVVCNMNLPYFKSINIGGGNIGHEKSLTYEKYKEQKVEAPIGFYETLWRFLLGGLLAMFMFRIFRFVST